MTIFLDFFDKKIDYTRVDIENYKFTYNQLNPISWSIKIKTPDGLNFSTIAQCHGQPNDLDVFNQLIVNKEGRKNLILDVESELIKEEVIKPEIVPEI